MELALFVGLATKVGVVTVDEAGEVGKWGDHWVPVSHKSDERCGISSTCCINIDPFFN